jgi:hypothetical protein
LGAWHSSAEVPPAGFGVRSSGGEVARLSVEARLGVSNLLLQAGRATENVTVEA